MTSTNVFEFKIWVGNLRKYTEGRLCGEWIDLVNMDADEIEKATEKIAFNPGACFDELFIADYDATIDTSRLSDYENISELKNAVDVIAELFRNYGDDATKIFTAALDYSGGIIADAIEIIENERFRVFSDCPTMRAVAEVVAWEMGYIDEMPEHLRDYFDYEAYANTLETTGFYQLAGFDTYINIF